MCVNFQEVQKKGKWRIYKTENELWWCMATFFRSITACFTCFTYLFIPSAKKISLFHFLFFCCWCLFAIWQKKGKKERISSLFWLCTLLSIYIYKQKHTHVYERKRLYKIFPIIDKRMGFFSCRDQPVSKVRG